MLFRAIAPSFSLCPPHSALTLHSVRSIHCDLSIMSVVSRACLPVWNRAAKLATPSARSLRFSTAAAAPSPLNTTKAAKQQHLENLLTNGLWKGAIIDHVLYEAKDRRSSALTQRVVAECIDVKTVAPNDFVRALQSFGLSDDAESALSFYKSAVEVRPELQTVYSLQAVMSAIRPDEDLYLEMLDIYHRALEDSEHFPHLRTDQHAAAAALNLYAYVPSEQKLPAQLTRALTLRDMLLAEGVKLDIRFYSKLILACNNHNHYPLAKEMYTESQASLTEPSIILETAILKAATHADNIPDCLEIIGRITSSGAPLNDKALLAILNVALKLQDRDLALSVAQLWRAAGGVLTWPMCDVILTIGLDAPMLAHLSWGATNTLKPPKSGKTTKTTSQTETQDSTTATATPGASAPTSSKEELDAANALKSRATTGWIKLLRGIVNQVKDNLYLVRDRSLFELRDGVETDFSRRSDSDNIAHTVPVRVMSKVAALLAEDVHIGVELILQRLELAHGSFPSVAVQKRAHVSVVHALARDLALLGRWRELLSLSQRLDGYRYEGDSLRYSAAERAAVETYTGFALIRSKQADRAAQFLSTRLAACLAEASAEEVGATVSAVLHSLHTLGGGAMAVVELAQVLQHCVPVVDPATAERLVTEALLSAVKPGEISLYLQALVDANASSSTTSAVRDFKLADHQVDIIEAVLSAQHDAAQQEAAESARELLVSLTTPLAGV